MKSVKIGNKKVGDGFPCFFVAEIGGLFKDLEEAKRLIDTAISIGVDAIKFQTLEADTITTKKNYFDLDVTGKILQYDFFKKFELSKELQMEVVKYANNKGITVFSAPSHLNDVEFMEQMELQVYKIGSDLACHIPLLEKIAKLDKPIILSTGMCTLTEVKESVNSILSNGNEDLILLHCVSDYPAKIQESNLNAIKTMKTEFDLPVGYSDHTIGITLPFAAAVMGANLVEKHFKHPQNLEAADDIHALDPPQFSNLIKSVREFENARGSGEKIPSKSEQKNLLNNRVSIVSIVGIPSGTIITKDMIDVRRPGIGLPPINFNKIIGKKTKINIPKEEPIKWEMFD